MAARGPVSSPVGGQPASASCAWAPAAGGSFSARPRRILCAQIWTGYIVVLISVYTANLAAIFTIEVDTGEEVTLEHFINDGYKACVLTGSVSASAGAVGTLSGVPSLLMRVSGLRSLLRRRPTQRGWQTTRSTIQWSKFPAMGD